MLPKLMSRLVDALRVYILTGSNLGVLIRRAGFLFQLLDSQTNFTNNFDAKNYANFKTVEVSKMDKRISFKTDENDVPIVEKREFEQDAKEDTSNVNETSYDSFSKSEIFSKNVNGLESKSTYSLDYTKSGSEPPVKKESFSSFSSFEPYSFYLEPGPPPEIGYIPKDKEAPPKTREVMAERVKKLESSQRQLSPVEIPAGGVKIFPTIVTKHKQDTSESSVQQKYSFKKTTNESAYTAPNIQVSETPKVESIPIYRPQADVDLRPTSPRPSAEGVSMEKLWTSSQKKTVEESSHRPSTPNVEKFRVPDIKRSLSPQPSAEGVAMDKLWSHPAQETADKNRPHSALGFATGEVESKTDTVESFQQKEATTRTTFEEKGKRKFKWPPQEVSIEDSLVRKTTPPQDSTQACYDQTAYEKTLAQSSFAEASPQKYVYGGVKAVPYPTKPFSVLEKQETANYQTLPRSFKFSSSSDSKFKPVKPLLKGVVGARRLPDSDYESDFEVTKISKQATNGATTTGISEQFSSESYSVKNVRESGYTADTDEPKGSVFLQRSNSFTKPVFSSVSTGFQKYEDTNTIQSFPRTTENKVIL